MNMKCMDINCASYVIFLPKCTSSLDIIHVKKIKFSNHPLKLFKIWYDSTTFLEQACSTQLSQILQNNKMVVGH